MAQQEICIRIDGRKVGPGEVAFMYQSDPCPGGLKYNATILRNAISREVWDFAKLENCLCPTEDQERHWMYWLFHICSRHPDSATATKMPFVLNTISQMHIDERQVDFSGIASPFVAKE